MGRDRALQPPLPAGTAPVGPAAAVPLAETPEQQRNDRIFQWAMTLSVLINLLVVGILLVGFVHGRNRGGAKVEIVINTEVPIPIGFEEQQGLDKPQENEMKLTIDSLEALAGGSPLDNPTETRSLEMALAGIQVTDNSVRAGGGNTAEGLNLASAGQLGTVSFMGAQAKGKSFAFLIDRSGSMEENNAWRFAQQELVKSLRQLTPTMEFQVIFYNHQFKLLDLPGRDTLVKATQVNVDRAVREILQLRPEGGTDHGPAILHALRRLKPDVIFVMTDAEAADTDTRMIGNVTAENKRAARNGKEAQINVVQFRHDWRRQTADIERLATQNNGTYRVVDATAANAGPDDQFRL